MFDIGWSELFLIGIVVLIVVGFEDFFKLFYMLGWIMFKVWMMVCEFSSVMEDVVKFLGLDEVGLVLKDVNKLILKWVLGLDVLDCVVDWFEKWDLVNFLQEVCWFKFVFDLVVLVLLVVVVDELVVFGVVFEVVFLVFFVVLGVSVLFFVNMVVDIVDGWCRFYVVWCLDCD